MKYSKSLVIFIIFAIQCNGIKISCGLYEDGCYMDVGSLQKIDNDFLDMLTPTQKNVIRSIIDNNRLNNHQKRAEANCFINRNVSQEIISNYKTKLSKESDSKLEENLRTNLIFQPCAPFCFNPYMYYNTFFG